MYAICTGAWYEIFLGAYPQSDPFYCPL